MSGHTASHGRTTSFILQHSQGIDGICLQNPDGWLLSFNHSCLSWSQVNSLYQAQWPFSEKFCFPDHLNKTPGLYRIWLQEENLKSQNISVHLSSAPNHSKCLCNKEGKQHSQLLILHYFDSTIQRAKHTQNILLFSSTYDNDIAERQEKCQNHRK